MVKKLIFSLILVCFATAQDEECLEVNHIWFKPIIAQDGTETLLELDMSYGLIYSDGLFVYIWVKDLSSGELVQLIFDNGQYFSGDKALLHEGKKEEKKKEKVPENLEDYLKSLGKGQRIQKINME